MAEAKFGPHNTIDNIGLCYEVSQFSLGKGTKTATATAGAATLNQPSGRITTESLTTTQGSDYTLTLTNTSVVASDIVQATIVGGTNSAGSPVLMRATPAANQIVFVVRNLHGSAVALNGTLIIAYELIKGV